MLSRGVKPGCSGPAAKKVREWAAGRGYDLGRHRAVGLTDEDVRRADLVLYMDAGNLARLTSGWPEACAKARCLAEYVGEARIPDPAFVPRGPELDRLLGLVVGAAEAAGRELGE